EDVFASEQGVLVSDIETDSPAAAAGIQAGDLLLHVDGQPVSARFYEEIPSFYKHIADLPVGKGIAVELQRDGKLQVVQVEPQEHGRPGGEDFEAKEWGFAGRSITKQMARDRHLEKVTGVLVAGVKGGGAAEEGGLLPNDVVRLVDEAQVDNLDQFRQLYKERV